MCELLTLPFMQRALIAGIALAPLLALLGQFVIMRRMAFFADGIAHASLAGVAVGVLAGIYPIPIALLVAVIMATMIYWLERHGSVGSDAAIGVLFSAGMAIGVILLSWTDGYQPELVSFLFGNILAVSWSDIALIVPIAVAVVGLIILKYRALTLGAIDHDLAHVSGEQPDRMQLMLYIILAVAVVLGIKVVGVILVSALLVVPAVTAKLVSRSFREMTILSICIALATVIGGVVLSYVANSPTGPTVVLVGTAIFGTALVLRTK